MPPIRKSFSSDVLFPFNLVYKDTKSPQSELPDHLHDRYEMVYVYGGQGTLFIDGTFYEMNRGDLFVIPGNTIHRAFPDPVDPVTSTAMFFAPALAQPESLGDAYSGLYCFDNARKRKQYKLETEGLSQRVAETAFANIRTELASKKPGYRHAIRLLLQGLLLELNRVAIPTVTGGTASVDARIAPPWMRETLLYIDGHSEQSLGLSLLAARAAVSPAHFSRAFKQLTGMTVTDYVNAKRIVRAKELLRQTNEGVERIAERCGFDTLPHFHRVFKKMTGVTPGRYKRGQTGG